MTTKAKGKRAKTRHLLQREAKITPNQILKEFSIGDSIVIDINGSYHKGMPFRRFQGKYGIIKGKRGSCYVINVYDGNKQKQIVSHPIHLKLLK